MVYHLTSDDVSTLSGEGFITADAILGTPEERSAVMRMHVLDLARCADGVDRDVIASSILVASSLHEDPDAIAEDAHLADQVALGLMRALHDTGLHAARETSQIDLGPTSPRRVSQFVEVTVPRRGLEEHVPSGSTWSRVLEDTIDTLAEQ